MVPNSYLRPNTFIAVTGTSMRCRFSKGWPSRSAMLNWCKSTLPLTESTGGRLSERTNDTVSLLSSSPEGTRNARSSGTYST